MFKLTSSAIISLLLLNSCFSKNMGAKKIDYTVKARRVESYTFNEKTPLIMRSGDIPLFLVNYLNKMDRVTHYKN